MANMTVNMLVGIPRARSNNAAVKIDIRVEVVVNKIGVL